ncbi:MAG TPA: flagellar basal body-associated FliL family protein [Nevskiaceae bacterium]|nr:flagellar basal body-associated FliL family protein [Nevskiaceae bacterium]
MAEAAVEAEEGAAPAAAPKKKSKLPLIIGLVVVLAGAGGGAYFFMGKKSSGTADAHGAAAEGHEAAAGDEHGGAAKGNVNFIDFAPPFVVNLDDEEANRYLQVDMQARGADAHALDGVKDRMPRIRNAILLLLGQQKYHDINTREGKEKLQAQVLAEVQKIMTEETGKPVVDAIYFTSFVMQ